MINLPIKNNESPQVMGDIIKRKGFKDSISCTFLRPDAINHRQSVQS